MGRRGRYLVGDLFPKVAEMVTVSEGAQSILVHPELVHRELAQLDRPVEVPSNLHRLEVESCHLPLRHHRRRWSCHL